MQKYIKVDSNNKIIGLFEHQDLENSLPLVEIPVELESSVYTPKIFAYTLVNGAFIYVEGYEALSKLILTDKEMTRKLEDSVDVLISKNLVSINDYPAEFQTMYILKKTLRDQLR